jgi:hypothetical protein
LVGQFRHGRPLSRQRRLLPQCVVALAAGQGGNTSTSYQV